MIAAIPTLQTDRLVLRAPLLDDLPRLTEFFASERSHIVGGPQDGREVFKTLASRIGHWALRGFGLWHFHDQRTQRFLGWTGVVYAPGWDEPELGWTVMQDAERQGYAFEAATAARAYAATHLGQDGVISYIAPHNTRSSALAIRLGAVFERGGELLGTPCDIYRHPKVAA